MTNVFEFRPKAPAMAPTTDTPNPLIREAGTYSLEVVAVGIEIALIVTRDREVAKALMKKMEQAVNSNSVEVHFTLDETRKYLDYLDILQSPKNSEWRMEVGRYKLT